jgi:hypothetical protein
MKGLFVGFAIASVLASVSAFASMGGTEGLKPEIQVLEQVQQGNSGDTAGLNADMPQSDEFAGNGIARGRYVVTCYARNGAGRTFKGRGRNAQGKALDKCYARSNVCYALGCEQEFVHYGD